jgi:hypothetical protein
VEEFKVIASVYAGAGLLALVFEAAKAAVWVGVAYALWPRTAKKKKKKKRP